LDSPDQDRARIWRNPNARAGRSPGALARNPTQNTTTTTGQIRLATLRKSRGIAGAEPTTSRPQALWTTSSPRPYHSVGVGCHLGRSRSHASTPSLKNPGPPIPRRCRSMEPIPRRPPMRRPQLRLTRSVLGAASLRFSRVRILTFLQYSLPHRPDVFSGRAAYDTASQPPAGPWRPRRATSWLTVLRLA
jgi:hypothetical protein